MTFLLFSIMIIWSPRPLVPLTVSASGHSMTGWLFNKLKKVYLTKYILLKKFLADKTARHPDIDGNDIQERINN